MCAAEMSVHRIMYVCISENPETIDFFNVINQHVIMIDCNDYYDETINNILKCYNRNSY